ncbi:hypothetical protein MJK72_25780 [Klebsiella pneumoniae]|nr:hypothetical protein MJK72_25780 [Klebsiella pneumoniae]
MEMQALFTFARQALVKQVHQPGFALRPTPPHIYRLRTGAVPECAGSRSPSSLPNFARKPPPDRDWRGLRLQFPVNGIMAAHQGFLLDVVGLMAALFQG